MKRSFIAFLIAVGVSTCFALPISDFRGGGSGRFEYMSYTPESKLSYLRNPLSHHPEVKLTAELSFPKVVNGKVPAVVLLHGSDGIGPGMYKVWQNSLNEAGYATVIVDMFTPRGVKETNSDQSQFDNIAQVVDAYLALKLLATHPQIDSKRISLLGRSRGGRVAFDGYWDLTRAKVTEGDLRFASFIPIYPGPICAARLRFDAGNKNDVPMLILVGDHDKGFGDPAQCAPYFQELSTTANAKIQMKVYKGGYHGFDGLSKYHVVPVTVGGACSIELDMSDLKKGRDFKTSEAFSGLSQFNERQKRCQTVGRPAGGDASISAQAVKDVIEFLNDVK